MTYHRPLATRRHPPKLGGSKEPLDSSENHVNYKIYTSFCSPCVLRSSVKYSQRCSHFADRFYTVLRTSTWACTLIGVRQLSSALYKQNDVTQISARALANVHVRGIAGILNENLPLYQYQLFLFSNNVYIANTSSM